MLDQRSKEKQLLFTRDLSNEISLIEQDGQLDWQSLQKGDIVRIGLTGVTFITPFCLLGLLVRCRQSYEQTGNEVVLGDLSDDVYKYLRRMQFFNVCSNWVKLESDYSSITPWDEKPNSMNLIEIRPIDKDMRVGARDVVKVAGILKEREKDILSTWLKKDAIEIDDFVTVLSEIAQNIFEWSGDTGYVALNRYTLATKNKYVIRLSIIDAGRGLNNTVKKKIKNKYEHNSDYICYPFQYSLSRSRGGGLYKVFDMLKQWNGRLFVHVLVIVMSKNQ